MSHGRFGAYWQEHNHYGRSAIDAKRAKAAGDLTEFSMPIRIRGHVEMRLSPYRINPMKGFIVDQLARIKRAAPMKLLTMSPSIAVLLGVTIFVNWAENAKRASHYW